MKIFYLFGILLFRLYKPPYNFDYPDVRRDENQVEYIHGQNISDPYRWLENLDSVETKAFVSAQNALTKPYLRKCRHRDGIRQSLTQLMNYTRFGRMKKKGGRYFYTESHGLENQMSLYILDGLLEEPRILIDAKTLSSDGTTAILNFFPSPNGKYLAYLTTRKGSDWQRIHFMNVDSGLIFNDKVNDTKFTSLSWTHDNKGVFYSKYWVERKISKNGGEEGEISKRQLRYHVVGTDQEDDTLVVEFKEHPSWACSGKVSDDGKYLVVYAEDELGPVRIYYTPLDQFLKTLNSNPKLIPIVTDFSAEYYYVTNEEKHFYYLTNKNAPNWKLVSIDFDNPRESAWVEIIPERPTAVLDWAVAVNQDKLVVSYLEDVKSKIGIRSLDGKSWYAAYPLEPGSTHGLYRERNDTEFFFAFESMLTPTRIYRFDFNEHPYTPVKQLYRSSTISGFDEANYVISQEFYKSKDGTRIPLFLAHKKDVELSPDTPCLLYGYGGFNSVLLPYFSADQAMFIRNFNGVYAVANIRGGGEYGRRWYDGGRLLNKQNTFDDFQAAAEFLIRKNYTSSLKLTIQGASNGGLLVGASINQRPDLFGAAIAQVGVMDMPRFNKFPAGESWTSDYGNPNNATQLENILKYSPLHNVRLPEDNETQYPATLLFTGDHDDRVVPSHSYKFIAEMQYTLGRSKRQTNPLFLLVQSDAGHGHGKPTSKRIDEYTDIYSFICKALNLDFHPEGF